MKIQTQNGIPEVTVHDVHQNIQGLRLIDVRQPDEYTGELGHIAGAELITLGPDLMKFLENGNRSEKIVFICRSGGRSGNATAASREMGYQNTMNMIGGMITWNREGLPTET